MKNIRNNLITIDLFLDKPKQPCALRAWIDERQEHINDNSENAVHILWFVYCMQ